MIFHSASTMAWYSEGLEMRISALSFSALSSSSTLSSSTCAEAGRQGEEMEGGREGGAEGARKSARARA
jgi:hypothetical protein